MWQHLRPVNGYCFMGRSDRDMQLEDKFIILKGATNK